MNAKMVHDRKALKSYAQKLFKIFDQIYREGNGDIRCPFCSEGVLSHYYTRNENDNYGIWIECPVCHLLEHADVKGQPAGFKEDLVRLKYQQLDDHAWQAGR
jgi:hypothetical protein